MTVGNILGGFLFGGIGFVAFVYGKKTSGFRAMMLGIVLMGFPYFVKDTMLLYLVGSALTGALFIFRD